jgi:hypothetical protein
MAMSQNPRTLRTLKIVVQLDGYSSHMVTIGFDLSPWEFPTTYRFLETVSYSTIFQMLKQFSPNIFLQFPTTGTETAQIIPKSIKIPYLGTSPRHLIWSPRKSWKFPRTPCGESSHHGPLWICIRQTCEFVLGTKWNWINMGAGWCFFQTNYIVFL